jgi:hypothetical protein
MNDQPKSIQALTHDELTSTLLNAVIQREISNAHVTAFVTELMRRQQAPPAPAVTESNIVLPQLKKLQLNEQVGNMPR